MDQNANKPASSADDTQPTVAEPVAPAVPVSASPQAPNGLPGIPKDKKPLVIVGALVVVAAIGFFAFTSMNKVSQKDYRDAVLTFNDVSGDASDSFRSLTTLAYASSSSTETKIGNDVDDAKKALATYQESNKKFKDLKALKNKDVKAAYDTYENKYNGYVKYANSLIESLPQFSTVIKSCGSTSSLYDTSNINAYLTTVASCRSALSKAKDVSNKDFAGFAADLDGVYEKLEKIMTEYSQLATPTTFGSPDYTRARELRNELYEIRISSVYSDFTSNVTKNVKDADPADAMNDFGKLLRDNANK